MQGGEDGEDCAMADNFNLGAIDGKKQEVFKPEVKLRETALETEMTPIFGNH